MRRGFAAFLLMTSFLSGCIHPAPQFYKDQKKAFVDLCRYMEKESVLGIDLNSFRFYRFQGKMIPRTLIEAEKSNPDPISISLARVYAVNSILYTLNFFNTSKEFLSMREGELTTNLNSRFMVGLGEFRDPFTAKRTPGDVGNIFLIQGSLSYSERFSAPDSSLHEETFTEAVDLLKEQGKLYYPEYLKWVDHLSLIEN